ncbi:SH3 domain-containing protein [Sulfitobacter sp. SK012]|uniref:SH3 domain-containing protein n=1 Tax=Sulfitobacter sp. SK012 TaxID=1389005 RepID=UPI000E0AE739|nr:SH3 domain-containing protein [Sulfitobacter sp. SK012]AXI45088.1 SH3 domain-containing protein [Sulfitobacter sp. SK012]
MKTFIILTFGFLLFAFYQMSGGAGFEPASVRMANVIAAPAVAASPLDTATDTTEIVAEVPTTDQIDAVTRVALNLTSLTETPVVDTPEIENGATSATVTSSADTPAIIPSLIIPSLIVPNGAGADPFQVTAISQGGDIREVSGNRVNVRGGPSTDYSVVNKLERGDTVEVIEDTGTGWVRMRPVDGSPEGWMADFLLTSG